MAKRRKSRKRGGRRSKAARRRAALKGVRRRRARAVAAPKRRRRKRARTMKRRRRGRKRTHTTKRRRSRKRSHAKRRRRGRKRSHTTKRRRKRRSSGTKRIRRSRRRAHLAKTILMVPGRTLRGNPGRRRKRRSRRRGRRSYARRYRRRSYRRNPGGFLIDLAKKAVPVLLAFYGTRMFVSRIGPMIPGVASLGTLAGPVLSVGSVIGMNYATKKVAFLAKHKTELMLGSMGAALDSLIQAFAPASVKALVGMSDYVAVGDYFSMGAIPLDDRMTMSDYVAVGGDGVEEELGLEEELGVEEELGNDLLGGMPTGRGLLKTIPTQQFMQPIPARSFTRQIPAAGQQYDNPNQLYAGIFNGGFGR